MSAEAVTVVLYHSKAKGAAKLVMWGIANHHSDHGAWPAMATLAKYAGLTERRVRQIVRELVALGELSVVEQGGFSNHQYKTNRYHILLQCPPDCDGTMNHRTGGKPISDRGEISGQRGEILGMSGGKPASVEPNKEPNNNLIEPSTRLPENWQPKESDLEMMREHFAHIDLKLEEHAFRDYWQSVPGAKGKKVDWDATWRNWIRNAHKRAKPKPQTNDWEALRRYAEETDE